MQATKSPSSLVRPDHDSVQRALGQVGDAWSFLILREAYFGVRRFDAFQSGTGASPNILTDRLKKLVTYGVLEKHAYCERPPRFEYRLTVKGLDLYPAIVLLMRWGDRWLDDGAGPPLDLVHVPCGHVTKPVLRCEHCEGAIEARTMSWKPGRKRKR